MDRDVFFFSLPFIVALFNCLGGCGDAWTLGQRCETHPGAPTQSGASYKEVSYTLSSFHLGIGVCSLDCSLRGIIRGAEFRFTFSSLGGSEVS